MVMGSSFDLSDQTRGASAPLLEAAYAAVMVVGRSAFGAVTNRGFA